MTTVHTPPIDLYAETQDDREYGWGKTPPAVQIAPDENGELDEPAVHAGEHRLDQVLGW
jgi:hypothetical protein